MNEASVLGQAKHVIPPVTVPVRYVRHGELVSKNPRISELDLSIVICPQHTDGQRRRSLFLPLATGWLEEAEFLEPGVVGTPVVGEVEVPRRSGERKGARR